MISVRLDKQIHYAGELAYYDSFSGLIKVKVIKVDGTIITCKCTSTSKDKAYRFGETIVTLDDRVVPRKSVYIRDGQYRIRNNYKWR